MARELNTSSSSSSSSKKNLQESPGKPRAPKYPIVFCHGISGFDRLMIVPAIAVSTKELPAISFEYWHGIQTVLVAKGVKVFMARVPPYGSIEQRAQVLHEFLNKKAEDTENFKVNLVAHSMGGVDCRYVISKIDSKDKHYDVASLTTISTPHRGSEIADIVVERYEMLKKYVSVPLPKCIYQLTTSSMRQFNEEVKDDKNVQYFSYGARFKPQWNNIYGVTWDMIMSRKGGSNDGLVSVNSAKWGKYLGTVEDADHLDLINWINPMKKLWGRKFDATEFYLNIADELARRGF